MRLPSLLAVLHHVARIRQSPDMADIRPSTTLSVASRLVSRYNLSSTPSHSLIIPLYMSTHLAQHPASCSPLSISMGLGGPFAPEMPPLPVE